ncbi:MAG: phosphatase PAP2 family protein [Desulfobulbaceae bacterium]|nr:phosphatase PAP2 family protein [Desulfobulbaceae bacterium]
MIPFSSRLSRVLVRLKESGLVPLAVTVAVLTVATQFYVGDLAADKFTPERWQLIGAAVGMFLFTSLLLDLVASLFHLRSYRDRATGRIEVAGLWRRCYTNPLAGAVFMAVVFFGITSAQDLSELYRSSVTCWHDAELWRLEMPFFRLLHDSLVDQPQFWDKIYFLLWVYIITGFAFLYRVGSRYELGLVSIALVGSFFMTRLIAIHYPTAGPVFFNPGFFDLDGTVSKKIQSLLVLYMHGEIPQNGLIPGTMGMPSLHVGLTFLMTWFVARQARWTLWLTLPWSLLIWLSTVMLGWHYVVDGVGGIVVVAAVALLAHGLLQVMGWQGLLPWRRR